jgi:hypothetical protein
MMIYDTPRSEVYAALDSERTYQDIRWGVDAAPGRRPSDHFHSVSEWLLYIQDYTTEAIHICSREADPVASEKALNWIRKIAAMGVVCMEQNGAPKREV